MFSAGDELALIATQSHLVEARAEFSVSDYTFFEYGVLGAAEVAGTEGKAEVLLHQHALSVMVFRKAASFGLE